MRAWWEVDIFDIGNTARNTRETGDGFQPEGCTKLMSSSTPPLILSPEQCMPTILERQPLISTLFGNLSSQVFEDFGSD